MNDQADVNILIRGESPQIINNPILQIKLIISLSLSTKHELQVINTDKLDIMGVDCVLQTLHDFADVGGPPEIEEVQGVLPELVQTLLGQLRVRAVQFPALVLLHHGGAQHLVLDFEGAPERGHALGQEVNRQLGQKGSLTGATCSG
jgi:hypothetical protein